MLALFLFSVFLVLFFVSFFLLYLVLYLVLSSHLPCCSDYHELVVLGKDGAFFFLVLSLSGSESFPTTATKERILLILVIL